MSLSLFITIFVSFYIFDRIEKKFVIHPEMKHEMILEKNTSRSISSIPSICMFSLNSEITEKESEVYFFCRMNRQIK